jgi:hypothetical protein
VTFHPHSTDSDDGGLVDIVGYDRSVAEESAQPLDEQLKEIGIQLAWVRDYL